MQASTDAHTSVDAPSALQTAIDAPTISADAQNNLPGNGCRQVKILKTDHYPLIC